MAVGRAPGQRTDELRQAIGEMQGADLEALQTLIDARRKELGLGRRRKARVVRELTLRQAVLWSIGCLLLFFAIDGLVFHSGWYMHYLEPGSSAGSVESQIFWLQHEPEVVETAVFGDSRVSDGFSARTARAASGDTVQFRNLGIPGANPRVWYYLLRDADPGRRRFSTVVLAMDRYSDFPGRELEDRIGDLRFLAGRLRLTDCVEFSLSFVSGENRLRAFTGCVLRGLPLRNDLAALLSAPRKRFASAKDWRNHGHSYLDRYTGKKESFAGLSADYEKRTLSFPEGATRLQRETAERMIFPEPTDAAATVSGYRQKWLGRIVDFYAGTKTRIVFVELPRAPLPPADYGVPARTLERLSRRPGVVIIPAETFHDLEKPDLFADGLHLNHVGRAAFSEWLAKVLLELEAKK